MITVGSSEHLCPFLNFFVHFLKNFTFKEAEAAAVAGAMAVAAVDTVVAAVDTAVAAADTVVAAADIESVSTSPTSI